MTSVYLVKVEEKDSNHVSEFYFDTFEEAEKEYQWRKTYDDTACSVEMVLQVTIK